MSLYDQKISLFVLADCLIAGRQNLSCTNHRSSAGKPVVKGSCGSVATLSDSISDP